MTYVTEFVIEETTFHTIDGVETETSRHIRDSRQFDDLATAQEYAEASQDRFNKYASQRGGGVRSECKVVPVKLGFANNALYSDVEPFEIVRVVSDKTIEVRAMDATMADDWKPNMVSGGFSFHCTNNNDQRKAWVITSNEANPVVRIRKQKNGTWYNKSNGRFFLAEQPAKKYDFNF
jgi:hypothetical protein